MKDRTELVLVALLIIATVAMGVLILWSWLD